MPDNKHLPAYPQPIGMGADGEVIFASRYHPDFGEISQRTLIAAMCLQGMRSNPAQVDAADASLWILAQRDADGLLTHLQNTEK